VEDPDETETVETKNTEQVTETPDDERQDENAETFPRSYVEKLRTEAKGNRQRAETAEKNLDAVLRELFSAKVSALGKLADADDLPYDAELLADEDKLTEAVDALIARKPHLARHRVAGNAGQGVTGKTEEPFSLLGRLQQSV
jgi:hypothetical protein